MEEVKEVPTEVKSDEVVDLKPKEEETPKVEEKEEVEIKNFKGIKEFLSGSEQHYPVPNINYHRIAIAPMIDITDTHFRNLMRLFTRYSILYTEMVHEQAIHHHFRGAGELLKFDPVQHPVVLQLGGNDPEMLASAAKVCEDLGYDEINLNVGCPSNRVQSGKFGACLMKEPEIVAEIMKKMKETCSIPCTVKCRLGVDDFDSYEFAHDFVKTVSEKGGVQHFVVHARKAFLKGLNPAQNRSVPPLKYDFVLRLKKDFPHLTFSINGGFKTYEAVEEILKEENGLVGCMLGRAAFDTPWFFSDIDRRFYGQKNPGFTRREILQIWGKYGKMVLNTSPQTSIPTLNKPIINMFAGEKSNSKYRVFLSERANFNKYKDYEAYIQKAIDIFEFFNKESLDLRPVGCEEADMSIKDLIFSSIQNNTNNNTNEEIKDGEENTNNTGDQKKENQADIEQNSQNDQVVV